MMLAKSVYAARMRRRTENVMKTNRARPRWGVVPSCLSYPEMERDRPKAARLVTVGVLQRRRRNAMAITVDTDPPLIQDIVRRAVQDVVRITSTDPNFTIDDMPELLEAAAMVARERLGGALFPLYERVTIDQYPAAKRYFDAIIASEQSVPASEEVQLYLYRWLRGELSVRLQTGGS